MFVNIR